MGAELGTDFYCADDITDDLAVELDGRRAYAQAMYRRLTMASLFYSEDGYGVGVLQWLLGTKLTPQQIEGAIKLSLMKDERTQDVRVTVLNETIRVQCYAHDQPDFPLTLTVDKFAGVVINGSLG